MKKIMSSFLFVALIFAPFAFAEETMKSMPMGEQMSDKGMKKMYQCPMDGYLSEKAGKCPKCGMDLVEKQMKAEEVKAAEEAQGREKK